MTRTMELLDLSAAGPETRDEQAGFGVLETSQGRLPLVALDVRARLTGLASHMTVSQTFRNALEEPLEATYIFPLPDRAAVTSFRMRVGERVVEGELKERGEARQEYRRAIEAGHRASIAEEERSGTFSLRVGNIPAKEEVAVELTLVGPVPVSAGEATFRFPLVVAPRYVPGVPLDGPSVGAGSALDTDQVPDASRVTPPVLLAGFPNPVRLSLEVELDPAGLDASAQDWPSRVRSSLHSVIADQGPPWTVRLQPGERLNRDFILRYPVAASQVSTSLVASAASDPSPGTMGLMIVPPAPTLASPPQPRDIVLLLDRSGSMSGWKMVAARRAVGRLIDTLADHDRFTVLAFDDSLETSPHGDKGLIDATDRHRWQTLEWLGRIDARGGTEMGPALEEAVRRLAGGEAARERVLVLVTDGQVAGEDIVLRSVAQAGAARLRVHTLGIDRAVNGAFLRRLADLGGGVCELVESEEQLDAAMGRIHQSVASPVLREVRLEPIGTSWLADSLAPLRLPDLFAERPVMIFARHPAAADPVRLRIRAIDGSGRPWEQEVVARPGPSDVLLALWGRAKVRELEDRYAAGTERNFEGLSKQIVAVSLESHVLSRFTAYVAVDRSEVVNPGGRQHEIVQPVEMPDGWEMDMSVDSHAACASVQYCLGAPAAMPMRAFDMLADASGAMRRRLGRKRQASADRPPRDGIGEGVEAVRRALEALEQVSRAGARKKRFTELVDCFQRLVDALRSESHGELAPAEHLLRRLRETLAAHEQGDPSVLAVDQLRGLLDDLRALLARLDPSPLPPDRERFWT